MSQILCQNCRTEYLNSRFPLLTLLCAVCHVKMKKKLQLQILLWQIKIKYLELLIKNNKIRKWRIDKSLSSQSWCTDSSFLCLSCSTRDTTWRFKKERLVINKWNTKWKKNESLISYNVSAKAYIFSNIIYCPCYCRNVKPF